MVCLYMSISLRTENKNEKRDEVTCHLPLCLSCSIYFSIWRERMSLCTSLSKNRRQDRSERWDGMSPSLSHGKPTGSLREVYGNSMESLRGLYGTFTETLWKVYGNLTRSLLKNRRQARGERWDGTSPLFSHTLHVFLYGEKWCLSILLSLRTEDMKEERILG